MKKDKIIKAAKALNDSNLSEIKIKVDGIKEADLKELYMTACEAVPVEKEDFLPELVGEVYNALRDEEEAKEEKKEEEKKQPVKEEEKKEEEKKQPVKEKKPVKEKVTKKPIENLFENLKDKITKNKDKTVSGFITSLFLEPISLEQALQILKENKPDEKTYSTIGSIPQHLQYLKKKGYVVTEKGLDQFQITNYKEN